MTNLARRNTPFRVAWVVAMATMLAATYFSQTRNNPYSPSPSRKADAIAGASGVSSGLPVEAGFVTPEPKTSSERPIIAKAGFKAAKFTETRSLPPTEIYKVGVGDVLSVNLKNATQGSGYYTVRQNGMIDYPLAGENVIVAGQTVDTVKEILASGISLFAEPIVEVKVREYSSHKITVSGLVDRPGEKYLQREAMPLFVVRADAVVSAGATTAVITRAPTLSPERYDLTAAATDNVLIYPGNSVEFVAEFRRTEAAIFYLSGKVLASGQKNFMRGMTLYRAVIASGGLRGNPSKATIKRKNEKGILSNAEHDLRAIKDGKLADPEIYPGDVIEVKK